MQLIRADFANIHPWARVYFCQITWKEAELAAGERAFRIPAASIENNP